MSSFNEPDRKFELLPQFGFARLHFAAISLVIVTGQVQQSVQNEDFQLSLGRVPELGGIGGCYLGGYRQIACRVGLRRTQLEGQDVGGFVLVPILPVHRAEFYAGSDENRDLAAHPDSTPGFTGKQRQRPFANISRLVD
jgi:hypothetical protein